MSQPPPPPPGPYPPHQNQPFPQPGAPTPYGRPTKSSNRTLWIVLGIVGGVIVVCCGGGLLLAALGLKAADDKIDEERANDRPTEIEIGGEFEHDDFRSNNGWRIVDDGFGNFGLKGLELTNEASSSRTAYLEFTLYDGDVRLGRVSCTSDTLGPDETAELSCTSYDAYRREVDTIKVADSF